MASGRAVIRRSLLLAGTPPSRLLLAPQRGLPVVACSAAVPGLSSWRRPTPCDVVARPHSTAPAPPPAAAASKPDRRRRRRKSLAALSVTPSSGDAVTQADFAALTAALFPDGLPDVVVCAASGGADSTALALLTHQWGADAGVRVVAVVVDHGLQEGSDTTARLAVQRLQEAGVEAVVSAVDWGPKGVPRSGRVQLEARAARYAALCAEAQRVGATDIFMGHHRGDQLETFLHRFARGSGVTGLAGMYPVQEHVGGFHIVRPLLQLPKTRLVETCIAAGVDWVEDAANQDTAYDRVRIRQGVQPALADGSLKMSSVLNLVEFMQETKELMTLSVNQLIRKGVKLHADGGYAVCIPSKLFGGHIPPELSVRLLSRLMMTFGGRSFPPTLDNAQRTFENIMEGISGQHASGGILLKYARARRTYRHQDTVLKYSRASTEERRLILCRVGPGKHLAARTPVDVNSQLLWDNRFDVAIEFEAPNDGTPPPTGLYLTNMHLADFRELFNVHPDLRYLLGSLPDVVLSGLPVLCQSGDTPPARRRDEMVCISVARGQAFSLVPGLSMTVSWAPLHPLIATPQPAVLNRIPGRPVSPWKRHVPV